MDEDEDEGGMEVGWRWEGGEFGGEGWMNEMNDHVVN